jgi:fumarate reductase flavoprotein subunit
MGQFDITRSKSTPRRAVFAAAALAGASVLPTWRRGALAADVYDAIIIGAGTAGLPAAIFAAERGARVLVIEKAPILGGTLDRSGGQVTAAGTVYQKKRGIKDAPQLHYDDVMRITRNTSDPVLTKLWTDNAADVINWLAGHGLELTADTPNFGQHEHLSVARAHLPKSAARAYLNIMEPLLRKAEAGGKVTVVVSAKAADLIQDPGGAVIGVTVEDEKGGLQDFMGRNVVLTSGGCLANARLFEDLHGVPLYYAAGYPFCQGDGIILGQGAGGYVRGGEMFCPLIATLTADDSVPSASVGGFDSDAQHRAPWELWVNAEGRRFVAEDHPSEGHKERTLAKQTSHRLWLIFDQEILDKAPELIRGWKRDKYTEAFKSHPMFAAAPTLDLLGARTGLNPAALAQSVSAYNAARAAGAPDPMGREHRPAAVATPPYYAIRLQGYGLMTWAGLAVDERLRVIRPDGRPIPNLYGAGEVIGKGTFGDSYCNGSGVTPALTFGRLLGKSLLPV